MLVAVFSQGVTITRTAHRNTCTCATQAGIRAYGLSFILTIDAFPCYAQWQIVDGMTDHRCGGSAGFAVALLQQLTSLPV
ncbi:MAG: hypothetical protein ACI9NA_001342 [Gammaproteobacteria bacterium]|jgi:hypothetical protein|uniref:Uncharacterized protein n=1 Tax=hydrothermal vent metagenome TaxID=652676 RepID=A0A160TDV3_9ZZZZ